MEMKLLNVMSILVLSFGITAHADQEVVNDLPSVVRTCQEAHDGAPVLDGAKTLTISRDQFGATYLTVIQKDQFAGYSILIENRLLTRVTCMGIVPCERYEADGVA